MKKALLLFLICIMTFGVVGCKEKEVTGTNIGKGPNPMFQVSDGKKFKLEQEALNGVTKDGGLTPYMEISLPEDNPFVYSNFENVKELLTNGTGVIYFGFPECPWCRNLLPTLTNVLMENDIEKVYYFNGVEIRDKRSLDSNGNVIIEQEGTKEYYELIDLLKDHLGPYEGLNDESIKRLYFPTVVFVKDGEIVGTHIGTVDSQLDAATPLNEEQVLELKGIIKSYLEKIYSLKCETDKNC